MPRQSVFDMPFARVYPLLLAKVEKKGRTKAELDTCIRWLTGYDQTELDRQLADGADCRRFFTEAPRPNPDRVLITGKVCGVTVEAVPDPLMREIRYLDKLVDELARGWAMERVLRSRPQTP